MIAPFPLRRVDLWSIGALAVATFVLVRHPSWWTTGAFALAVTAVLLRMRSGRRRYERTIEENRSLRARVDEFGNRQIRFVGSIAHEIKTPLAVVLGQADLLLLNCHDIAAARGIVESMAGEVRHLSDLVDSFLQLAHPSMGEDTTCHVPVFVADVVIEAVGRCRDLSEKLGVRVVTVLSKPDNGDPSAEVMGDPLLLEVMVENLLRNALRFSPPDSKVELTTHADAESVGIVVRDHGIGIPSEQHELVFDWFFEGAARSSAAMGTGFGLAIAKRVVDHHGGTITLRDAPGCGCEFVITLPRCWPVGAPAADAAGQPREPPFAPRS